MTARRALRWRAGVDGGGSGTRVRLADADGHERGVGRAGPSGLQGGAAAAWQAVQAALGDAFANAGAAVPAPAHVALALGLAGVNNPRWAQAFRAAAPPWG